MDKMIQDGKGEVLIINDGTSIHKQMEVSHSTAKMLFEISKGGGEGKSDAKPPQEP